MSTTTTVTTDMADVTQSHWFDGTFTALSAITHFGDSVGGTEQVLRREKIVQPPGSPQVSAEVPVISGNSWRGQLRDCGMRAMLVDLARALGVPRVTLSPAAFHVLFSGGALGKDTATTDIGEARRLRALIPLLGVLGSAVGRQILEGKLLVGKIYPICRETRHLLPETLQGHPHAEISIYEFLGMEHYTRMDDAKRESMAGAFLAPAKQRLLEAPKVRKTTNKRTGEVEEIAERPGVSVQMRFGCVTAETPVLLADGRMLTAQQVDELYAQGEPVRLVSYDLARQRMTTAPISRAESWCVPETIEVRTRYGYSLQGAVDHRLLTLHQGQYQWKRLDEVHVGEYVALAGALPCAQDDATTLAPLEIHAPSCAIITKDLARRLIALNGVREVFRSQCVVEREGMPHDPRKRVAIDGVAARDDACRYPVTIAALRQAIARGQITEKDVRVNLLGIVPASRSDVAIRPQWDLHPDHLRLLGLLLSDGWFRSSGQALSFASVSADHRAEFRAIVERLFGLAPSRETEKGLLYSHTELTRFFLSVFGILPGPKSRTVRIPPLVFCLPEAHRRAFIEGYLTGDGTRYFASDQTGRTYGERHIIISSSAGLAQDMVYLLASLGIVGSLKVQVAPDRFASTHQRAMPDMYRVEWSPVLNSKRAYLPPASGYELTAWRADKALTIPALARQMGIASETIATFERGPRASSHATVETIARHTGLTPAVLAAPLNWTCIQEVRRLPDETRIYAFEIPEFHNYIAGTGPFVSHNCETYAAGTMFACTVHLREATQLELEAFMWALREWSRVPTLGGKRSIGLGRVRLEFPGWFTVDPLATIVPPPSMAVSADVFGDAYARHLATNAETILATLEASS